ncbi:hypothetical protein [Peptostreptococcus equinus]|uniref:Uncharacterized protein n=1 Tax=Peptostreptococcus equinus TaxID=3003601 RepID=A0ABY7JNH6_9FIRM|nr:hypothetical protein [Peptostreptococcus sp. CBA3647]WAW14406.1 hypothetical protein O0R46_07325 [Peptostreptococcus sp. CBA3647]
MNIEGVFEKDIFNDINNGKEINDFETSEDIEVGELKGLFYVLKSNEIINKYHQARLVVKEFFKENIEYIEEYNNREVVKGMIYEHALFLYNAVIDLLFCTVYLCTEQYVYKNGKKITNYDDLFDNTDIEKFIRDLERNSKANTDTIEYFEKMDNKYGTIKNELIKLMEELDKTKIRSNFNFIKHRGMIDYGELKNNSKVIEEINKFCFFRPEFRPYIDIIKQERGSIYRFQNKQNLANCISELIKFDNDFLFGIVKVILEELYIICQPTKIQKSSIMDI